MFAAPQAKPKSEFKRPPVPLNLAKASTRVRLERDADRRADEALRKPAATSRAQQPVPSGQAAHRPVTSSISHLVPGSGALLQPAVRKDMEHRFGEDFSHVRVHTNEASKRSAHDLGAQAYTYGSHIVFGSGNSPFDRSLLAHELAHVAQQPSGPVVLRQPAKSEKSAPAKPEAAPALPEWKPADAVVELRRVKGSDWYRGDDWVIALSGRTSVADARALLWKKWFPPDIAPMTVDDVKLIEPFEMGVFTITGLDAWHLEFMEPSIAAIFRDHGLVAEDADQADIAKARKAFRSNNSDLDEGMERRVHTALIRVTRGNADLMLAFYLYYSSHDFESDDISALGDTKYGNTTIGENLLVGEPTQPTSDPLKLLGSTLIHEFSHTPQGGWLNDVEKARNEGKAYAIEVFFAERMGDKGRGDDIDRMWPSNDPVAGKSGGNEIFNRTYRIIKKLYDIVDRRGGGEAAAARRMSVELISKNEADYGPELKNFIAENGL